VESLSTFFQFIDKDSQESSSPNPYRSFFQQEKVMKMLQNQDRFIICFGMPDGHPVCDFGFVRKTEMDIFRRKYLRTAMTSYNMLFEGKFRLTAKLVEVFAPQPEANGKLSTHQLDALKKPFVLPEEIKLRGPSIDQSLPSNPSLGNERSLLSSNQQQEPHDDMSSVSSVSERSDGIETFSRKPRPTSDPNRSSTEPIDRIFPCAGLSKGSKTSGAPRTTTKNRAVDRR
jgi:hypothetical protein